MTWRAPEYWLNRIAEEAEMQVALMQAEQVKIRIYPEPTRKKKWLCRLGFHHWHRPAVWLREMCVRCGKMAPPGFIPNTRWWR